MYFFYSLKFWVRLEGMFLLIFFLDSTGCILSMKMCICDVLLYTRDVLSYSLKFWVRLDRRFFLKFSLFNKMYFF
jgi:hypothetical protein